MLRNPRIDFGDFVNGQMGDRPLPRPPRRPRRRRWLVLLAVLGVLALAALPVISRGAAPAANQGWTP